MAAESLAAIVLAAGMSRRMGDVNKLHLTVDGVPLIRRAVNTLLSAGLDEIVVVLGHQRRATEALLCDLPVAIVFNADYERGQMSSVHCGLSAVSDRHSGVVVALGDQPALQTRHIDFLREAFFSRDGGDVVVPFFNGERGNPIVVSEACRQRILAGERNLGCRRFIDDNPALVRRIDMPDAAVLSDLDTPADYQKFTDSGQLSPAGA